MALNPKIDALVTELPLFAVNQGVSEARAFKIALVRLCKAWATGQTTPKAELLVIQDALEKLTARQLELMNLTASAAATVAANHQAEVDAIINGTVIPE
jgi:hypothetical protein